jgi:hypothetical protein
LIVISLPRSSVIVNGYTVSLEVTFGSVFSDCSLDDEGVVTSCWGVIVVSEHAGEKINIVNIRILIIANIFLFI